MISLLCCNICNPCFRRRAEVDKFSDDVHGAEHPVALQFSFQSTRTMEEQVALDQKIAEWQQALVECESLEKSYLEAQRSDSERAQAEALLAAMRDSPEAFLNNPSSQIIGIALKRGDIAALQKKLGVSGHVRSSQALSVGREVRQHSRARANTELEWNEGELRKQASYYKGGAITQQLSSIWTMRLNSVKAVQEDFRLGVVDPVVRPKWPSYLHDVAFDVLKVNKYGQQLKRSLKLTQFHVITIKNESITKFYRLSDVRRVWLQSGNIIKVILRNDKKSMYVSPIAPHILQQIITRVQMRHALDHTDFTEDAQQLGYTVESTAAMIQAISEESAVASEEVMFAFANDLKLKVLPAVPLVRTPSTSLRIAEDAEAVMNVLHQSSSSTKEDEKTILAALQSEDEDDEVEREVSMVLRDMVVTIESSIFVPPPCESPSQPSPQRSSLRSPSTAQHFLHFASGSPEHQLQSRVREIVSDPSTPEGNTLKLFIQSFLSDDFSVSASEKLLKLRNFIDGMHEHIVVNSGYRLAIKFQQDKQRSLIFKNSDAVNKLRRKSILSVNANFPDKGLDLRDLDEDVLTWISFVVFIVVEETVFLPLKDCILGLLAEDKDYTEERNIIDKMKKFSKRSQEAWSIPELLVSPLNWKTAIFELSQLENNLTPTHQLMTLTRTMKAVYNEFKVAILPNLTAKGFKDIYIAADDLVPIFLYILAHTNLRHPLQNRDLMWALCHPDQLHGEAGYYLTVYESAVEFITHETMDAELAGRNSVWMSRSSNQPNRSLSTRSSNSVNSNILRNVMKLPVASYYDDQQDAMRESFA